MGDQSDHILTTGEIQGRYSGALADKNLEQLDTSKLVSDLEDWERYLRSDPELAQRLLSLENSTSRTAVTATKVRGPRP